MVRPLNPELVDLDGDGDLDAAVGENFGSGHGRLLYFENTGTSSSPAFVEVTGDANPFLGIEVGLHSSPELVDLDGDGDLDALIGERGGHLVFFRSLAEAVFADGFEDGDTSAWSASFPPP